MPVWSSPDEQNARRAAIIREAAGCFNRKGYHGTTIEDIAKRLNVSKAALYYYLKNKEELLFECHQIALDVGMEGLRIAQELDGPPDAKLKLALLYYIEGVTAKLQGPVVLLEEGMLTPKHYREVVRRRDIFEQRFRLLVQAGIADGIFAPRDPKMAVFAMLGAANWIYKWYSPKGERTSGEIAEIFVEYLIGGLYYKAGEAVQDPGTAAVGRHADTDQPIEEQAWSYR